MIPSHWWLQGPGKPRPAINLFRSVRVAGGHASTLRRLLRIGPWAFYVVRYRPGDGPEPTRERTP